jgi:hypothetical protein
MKEKNMNKVLFLLAVLSTGVCMSGFTQTTTNNNTVIINGVPQTTAGKTAKEIFL